MSPDAKFPTESQQPQREEVGETCSSVTGSSADAHFLPARLQNFHMALQQVLKPLHCRMMQ